MAVQQLPLTPHEMRSVGAKKATKPPLPISAPIEAEWDEVVAARLQSLRRRGSGINLRTTRSTTARMARILKLMGLTGSQHSAWCGWSPKEWLKENAHFSEREWATLVAENYDQIKHGVVS